MKKLLTLALLCLAAVTSPLYATTVNYTADNSSIFPNPERGYYLELDHVVTASDPYCVKNDTAYIRSKYVTPDRLSVILVLYYLDNYKNEDVLPEAVLRGFDEDMQALRQMGLKCILRFAYTADDTGEIGYDAPLSRVEKHIAQYKSHWEANADVIFCFQAGFVGAWGEWYYTSNFGNKQSTMNESRRALVDTLLKAVPADRYIQLRTPLFKTGYIGDTQALTKEEAYSGTPRARLGHHNDAFLYGPNNMGTYNDTATQKPYVAQEALYVPLGGETDITEKDKAEEWATYDKTIAEMSRMHWTFIQGYYAQTTTDMWRNNGTFDELNRRMGYRYQLVTGTYGSEVKQGGKLSVNIQIRNAGFAPLYNERHAYIVLKNDAGTYPVQLQTDPRSWLPNGVVSTVEEQIIVPETVPAGTYQLYLHLPDVYASLAADARYAVRFANADVWDGRTGMNSLNASVTVTQATTPDPKPDPEPETEAILLPATLDKSNVTAYSTDMTWFRTDYFDFGPVDATNLERWAEWSVNLKYPGKYIVSEVGYCANGHSYALDLMNGENVVSTFTALDTDHWGEGDQSYTQKEKWDLSAVAAGVYTLHVHNATAWGQPKLKSVTLQYNGSLPTGMEQAQPGADNRMYDVLGRPVDASYHGIVIQRGVKRVQ